MGALRRFLADEDASLEVEYTLISALVVAPIFFIVPPLLMTVTFRYFDLIQLWINLPFP